ncbi:MAG: P-loop NTPase fold protein [Candidatus Dojkabacteria bacterium]|nr:MAG: P-loop NTPase fold protein [Candidatus Dojkabacteria bacterium]
MIYLFITLIILALLGYHSKHLFALIKFNSRTKGVVDTYVRMLVGCLILSIILILSADKVVDALQTLDENIESRAEVVVEFYEAKMESDDSGGNVESVIIFYYFLLGVLGIGAIFVGSSYKQRPLNEDDVDLSSFLKSHQSGDKLDRDEVRDKALAAIQNTSKSSVAITGGWGTGKSFVLAEMIKGLKKPQQTQSKNVVIYASFLGATTYNDILSMILEKIALEIERETGFNLYADLAKYGELISTIQPEYGILYKVMSTMLPRKSSSDIQRRISEVIEAFHIDLYVFLDDIERDVRAQYLVSILKIAKDLSQFNHLTVVTAFDKHMLSKVIGKMLTKDEQKWVMEGEAFLGGTKFFDDIIPLPSPTKERYTEVFLDEAQKLLGVHFNTEAATEQYGILHDHLYENDQDSIAPLSNIRSVYYARNIAKDYLEFTEKSLTHASFLENRSFIPLIFLLSLFKAISQVSPRTAKSPTVWESYEQQIQQGNYASQTKGFSDSLDGLGRLVAKINALVKVSEDRSELFISEFVSHESPV